MTEAYFTKRGDHQNKKPRKRKRQNDRGRPPRIVRIRDGLVYKEIIYEDGEIVLEKKDS
jgi:hypothetical protein